MGFRIEFYHGLQRLGEMRCESPLENAVRLAREGLATRNARFAQILDKDSKPVEMVHQDVLP